ncbi:MAG: hypothetical protein LBU74_00555 [Methanobacteriaceae archaeon]|jgi:hypothetical protein|nr:hypothetical protein [Candidatus Methanorudis spinitermitis]
MDNVDNLENKIIEILKKNQITPIISGDPLLLGTIRIYEEKKLFNILNELKFLFKEYKSYSLSSYHVSSCCALSYEEIRYKIEI